MTGVCTVKKNQLAQIPRLKTWCYCFSVVCSWAHGQEGITALACSSADEWEKLNVQSEESREEKCCVLYTVYQLKMC